MHQNLDGKKFQLDITGFLEKKGGEFVEELWNLLLDASSQPSGIPYVFIQKKKEELEKQKKEELEKQRREEVKSTSSEQQSQTSAGNADHNTLNRLQHDRYDDDNRNSERFVTTSFFSCNILLPVIFM